MTEYILFSLANYNILSRIPSWYYTKRLLIFMSSGIFMDYVQSIWIISPRFLILLYIFLIQNNPIQTS
jgi:hypothetical protein